MFIFVILIFFSTHSAFLQAKTVTDNEIFTVIQIITPTGSWGSGVIIDIQGRIITNYHVVKSSPFNLTICTTVIKNTPPICNMKAEAVRVWDSVDLALLEITQIDGVDINEYRLRYGDPTFQNYAKFDRTNQSEEGIDLGDELQVLGYPAAGFIGGETITFSKGSVSGFFEKLLYKGKNVPWRFKTDTTMSPGNSGGGAFDSNNNFIGIPAAVDADTGTIGYVISIPIINVFLEESIGSSYLNPLTPRTQLKEEYMGFLTTTSCPSNSEKWGTQNICRCSSHYFAVGDSCISGGSYCKIKGGSYTTYLQKCEGIIIATPQQTPQITPVTSEPITSSSASTTPPVSSTVNQDNDTWLFDQIKKQTATNNALVNRLLGRIIIQIQEHGEAWYIDPVTKKRYYMKDGAAAYQMLRSFGTGISNIDLEKLQKGNKTLINKFRGRILLQVQSHGEAFYIHPITGVAHYMKDGAEAYRLMRELSLGIANIDITKIPIGEIVKK